MVRLECQQYLHPSRGTCLSISTLRGHVRTEATRRKIGQLAEKYWRSENVSNLLEVRPD